MTDSPRYLIRYSQLQTIFNKLYLKAIEDGKYREAINPKKDRLAPASAGQVSGSRAQSVKYFDSNGIIVAVVHRYLRPDGTIGASGMPDPKLIRVEGMIFWCHGQNLEDRLIAEGKFPAPAPELDVLLSLL